MPPVSAENHLGRTGLVVLCITLATCGGFALAAYVLQDDTETYDTLLSLMFTIGGVGLLWALVLAARAVWKKEALIWPFFVVLPLLWGVSVPLLNSWRGGSIWRILPFFCIPLLVPLATFALTLAAPLYAGMYWGARNAEMVERAVRRRRAGWLLIAVAGVIMLLILPFAFYYYGGTMLRDGDTPHWTTSVVRMMPRWIGDCSYQAVTRLPHYVHRDYPDELARRGLLSASFLTQSMATLKGDPRVIFKGLIEVDSSAATEFVRTSLQARKSWGRADDLMGRHFAETASSEELKEILRLTTFNTLRRDMKEGLLIGLYARANREPKEDFVLEVEPLLDGDPVIRNMATGFLSTMGDDNATKRLYSKLLEMNVEELIIATDTFVSRRRAPVLAMGLQLETPKRHQVLKCLLKVVSTRGWSSELRESAECQTQFKRLLHSSDEMDRVLAALVLLAGSRQEPKDVLQKYMLNFRARGIPNFTEESLRNAGAEENNAVVERARKMLTKN